MARDLHHRSAGTDRSYKRGAIMGLTVAEAFILLCFCLLLLFTWWQIDTEENTVRVDGILSGMKQEEVHVIRQSLADGSAQAAQSFRQAGIDLKDQQAVDNLVAYVTAMKKAGVELADKQAFEDLSSYSRFIREEDMQRLLAGVVLLSPETRLSLANAVQVTDEALLRAKLRDTSDEGQTVSQIANRIAQQTQQQADLVEKLDALLGDKIRAANGSIDSEGTITLPQDILFISNSATVTNPELLKQICNDWLATLQASGVEITDLKIEGHASSEYQGADTLEQAYLGNLALSQQRAQNSLAICLRGLDDVEQQDWAKQHLAAIGYSSSRLIHNPDGSEDADASRRVMFSMTLGQTKLINEIKRDVLPEASDEPNE